MEKQMTLTEVLEYFDFAYEIENEQIALIDLQGVNLGGIESDRFDTAEDVFERMGIYINDYLLDRDCLLDEDGEDFNTVQEVYDYCKEIGRTNILPLLYAILQPDTVILDKKGEVEMKEDNKPGFIKELERVLRMTRACQKIELSYGSLNYEPVESGESIYQSNVVRNKEGKHFKQIFVPSNKQFTSNDTEREMVQITVDGRTFYQSIEGNSCWGSLLDIVKRLESERV